MILRLIGWQGVAGVAIAAALGLLLLLQKSETRHWRRQSGHYEQLYRGQSAAFAGTIANYRAAAERARAADLANAARAAATQAAISERTDHDFQARLDLARARALQLRSKDPAARADPRAGRGADLPGLSAPAGGAAQAPGEDRLPRSDALTATEQAIQLDELIKWITRQHRVTVDAAPVGH